MTTPPRPPAGVVEQPPILVDRGEVARWRHADRLPYLEVILFAARDDATDRRGNVTREGNPPLVTVTTGPGRFSLDNVTDPAELRRCAWTLLAAARWQEAERDRLALEAATEPDPQLTIYDELEAAAVP